MRMSAEGARAFLESFDEAQKAHREKPVWREGRSFKKAYLIDLLQHMLEAGHAMHRLDTHGGYMEIDTVQDAELSEQWWNR